MYFLYYITTWTSAFYLKNSGNRVIYYRVARAPAGRTGLYGIDGFEITIIPNESSGRIRERPGGFVVSERDKRRLQVKNPTRRF